MVCYATPLIGGPEKTRINRYGDNSPRETRRTIMQSLSIHENFSGFQSTREHNASNLPKCLDEAALQPHHRHKSSKSFNTLQQIPNKKKETPKRMSLFYKSIVSLEGSTLLTQVLQLHIPWLDPSHMTHQAVDEQADDSGCNEIEQDNLKDKHIV